MENNLQQTKQPTTNTEEYFVGLDIGTTKIIVMVARLNEFNKLEVLGVGKSKSIGVRRGMVNNIALTVQSIQDAVKDAEEKAGVPIKEVVVGIAGKHIRSLQHSDYITREKTDRLITQEDIDKVKERAKRLVLHEGERIIQILPQEYKVDGKSDIVDAKGMYGNRIEANFHIVVGQNSSIKNIGDCVKMAGLELKNLMLEPLSSSEAVLTDEEKEAGVILVDIGGGTTDLAIIKDNMIRHTAVIDMGGNCFTKDIQEAFSIIQRHAEEIKIKYGDALPRNVKQNLYLSIAKALGSENSTTKEINLYALSKVIYHRVVTLEGLIKSELKNYGYKENNNKLIAGAVITGGGSMLKNIKFLLNGFLGMDVRIGIPNKHLAGNSVAKEITTPIYATSIGLAMNAIQMNDNDNHPEIQEKKEEEKTATEPMKEEQRVKKLAHKNRNYIQIISNQLKHFLDKAE